MRDTLAERVLASVVDWDAEKLSRERLDLELLAELKYDEYRQFSPGMKYIESLSLWLGQFGEGEDRNAMYDFVKERLVFISNAEMQHYIKMAYADHIKPILIREAARRAGISEDRVARIAGSKAFAELGKKCLYLGLSDGSRMDDFRRFSSLGHEQVYPTYEIATERRGKMLESLAESLGCGRGEARFEAVFLIDDFSASGLSYLRETDGKFGGKIKAFLGQFAGGGADGSCPDGGSGQKNSGLADMFAGDLLVVVLLYVATDRAVRHIRQLAPKLFKGCNARVEVVAVHEICEASAAATPQDMGYIEPILKKQFDNAVVTDSYRTGAHQKPHMGFDECGLVVVLSHNCPNNTLPVVWHESDDSGIRALFPRHQRFAGG